jgi:TRAP-type uncharacterized transport system substrate-binding protein
LLVLLIFAVASSLPAKAANPGWPKSLTIETASPGGVYVPYGRALAKLWTAKIEIMSSDCRVPPEKVLTRP